MDEVGFAEHREIGTVVDDRLQRSQSTRDLTCVLEARQELCVGQLLLADLDDVHAAADRGFEEGIEIRPLQADQVQPLIHRRPAVR